MHPAVDVSLNQFSEVSAGMSQVHEVAEVEMNEHCQVYVAWYQTNHVFDGVDEKWKSQNVAHRQWKEVYGSIQQSP